MLTQEYLKEILDYNPDTGKFVWKVVRSNRTKINAVAGSLRKDYLYIRINKKAYQVHRLAWLYTYGCFPYYNLDHIDQNKLNNKINNLREASKVCNARNCGNPINNTSGVKGVCWCKSIQKWRARIKINYKNKLLGAHSDFLEAVYHRLAGEQCLNWSNCDSSSPALQHIQEFARTASVD